MKKVLASVAVALSVLMLVSFASLAGGGGDDRISPSETGASLQGEETDASFVTAAAVDTFAAVYDSDSSPAFGEETEPESEVTTEAKTEGYPLSEGERVVYDEDGVQYIEGSSLLFGEEPADDTTAEAEEDPFKYDGEAKYPTSLMYHCVHDEPYTKNTALFVRPSELEAHCQVIKELGLQCLFADEFGPVTEDSVILTFDDGYEDNYTYMFPIIKKYNIKVTVFMIAYKIDKPGYLTTAQIKEMSDSGLVQFGSHTLDHPSLTKLSEEEIRQQMVGSAWIISQITGKSVNAVAYPSGRYNSTVMEIASEVYDFAYTTDDDPYYGQDMMMLPRYAILRDMGGRQFRRFVD